MVKSLLRTWFFGALVAYFGVVLGTILHEVIGHGLMAIVVGGSFEGFEMSWTGTGTAFVTSPESPPLADRMVYGAGVGIDVLVGIGLLRWSRRRRANSVAAFVALVLGAVALHESILYVYFSAWSDDARIDAVTVMHTLGDVFDDRTVAWPRWIVVAIAGAAGIATHRHCVRQLLSRIGPALGDNGDASRVRHLAALAALYVAPVVFSAWYRVRGYDPLHHMGPATISVALAAVIVAVGVVVRGPSPLLTPLIIRRHHFVEGLVVVATFTAGVNFVWCRASPSAVDDEPAIDPIADYALAATSVGPRAVAPDLVERYRVQRPGAAWPATPVVRQCPAASKGLPGPSTVRVPSCQWRTPSRRQVPHRGCETGTRRSWRT